MKLNKWRLEAIVRKNSKTGISLNAFATELGVCRPAAMRHARKHMAIVVEDSRGGKGAETRLWWKYDLPDRLQKAPPVRHAAPPKLGPRVYTLDEL